MKPALNEESWFFCLCFEDSRLLWGTGTHHPILPQLSHIQTHENGESQVQVHSL